MAKIVLLLFFIDFFVTQLVFSQYSNNESYNRMYNQRDINREDMPTNQYNNDQHFDGYNQQKSQPYSSEYKEMPMPYQFEYNTDDGYGNKQDRQEKADEYGNVVGSYGYMDSKGIYRKVHYTAGPEGFKAKINSNEPFLKPNANPADVMLFVEEPPNNAIIYGNQKTNSYTRDEQNDKYYDMDSNQMMDQVFRASDNQIRGTNKRYVNNDDYGSGRMRPFLDMFRPKQNFNRNQEFYSSVDSFGNHRNGNNNEDIEAYASNRRYYD